MLRPAIVGALISACLVAQSAPPQFRVRTDLVKLDVSVTYPDRQPVRGLEARHFVILEDGVEQPIDIFGEVQLPEPVPLPEGWQRDTAADIVSNSDDPAGRLVAIVLDDGDPKMTAEVAAASADIARDLIEHLSPGDRGAIVYSRQGASSSVVTSDRAQLLAAVKRFRIDRKFISVPEFRIGAVGAARSAAVALGTASDRRKIVVFISPGAPIDMTKEMFDGDAGVYWQVDGAVSAADRDNITIYAIDPTAMVPPAPMTAKEEKQRDLRRDFLERFTEWGFGFAIVNAADYDQGVDRIFRESTTYYTLGYRIPERKKHEKPPLVEVRVKRQGLMVRARTTRVDDTPRPWQPKPKPPPPPLSQALRDAQLSALPLTELPISVAAAVFRAPGKNDGLALITTAVGETDAGPSDDTINVALRSFQPFSRDRGREPAAFVTAPQTVSSPTEIYGLLTLRAGYHRLEIGAERVRQSRFGSVRVPLDVPNYEKDPFSLSGVVINSDGATASIPAALRGIVPFAPTTRRTFGTRERMRAFLQVYINGKAPLLPASMVARVRDVTGAVVFELATTIGAEAFGPRGTADYSVELPLARLAPGPHLLTIESTRGLTTLLRDIRFNVR